MTNNKKAATLEGAAQNKAQAHYSSNDTAAQRHRILDFLCHYGSLSTLDARHKIDVMHPAARVMELRRLGHEIETIWSHETTPEGGKHRVARYHLMSEARAC
ncbi:helix-turn-helix domain-containing protein [Burkholderia cenocepacia]|uniref:helix-turn-helix domain-containing protein n=1 Tax=Burkholderia cenocepacia TaxID=95486 RepID=UPI0022371E91|nr:helix-turn-helix domain-containing protein [Burkholderia cenocepacia]MCW5144302.1 helix-turn-helix domain-containing protein [Burkholderia cenocepacia]